jgi:hypothetical protein
MTSEDIFGALCELPPGQFDMLPAKLGIPSAILSGASAPQATRAAEVVKWAKAQGRLDDIAAMLPSDSPQQAWHRDLQKRLQKAQQRRSNLEEVGVPADAVANEIRLLRRQLSGGRPHGDGERWADRYVLTRKLGQGGFAEVWLAVDTRKSSRVALKILHGAHAGDAIRRERFLRGARKMSELAHPAIAKVFDIGPDDDETPYFTMELFEGGDLHQATLAGRISSDQVLPLILEVGGALAAAHGKGFVHRDVKPANVLLRTSGAAALSDFDLVAYKDTDGGTRTGVLGTVVYAAPELLLRPQEADATADVYGLAMTAIFALRREDLSAEVFRDVGAVIDELDVDPGVRAVLKRATLRDQRRRYASAAELCEALTDALRGGKLSSLGALAAGERNVLVWSAAPGRAAETFWLRVPASGDKAQIAGVRRGRWFAYGDRLYEWQASRRPVRLLDPADLEAFQENGFDTKKIGHVESWIQDAHLVDVLSSLRVPAGSSTPEALASTDAFDFGRTLFPLGSVPRFVFILEADYTYSGGAHGNQSFRFQVLDLEALTYADPLLQDERQRIQERHGARAFARLQREHEGELFPLSEVNGAPVADLTLLYPSYEADGRLRIMHQFTTGAAYTMSDHRWDSYSVSTLVDDDEIPCLLRPYEHLDTAVLRACPAAGAPDTRMGWSEVTSAAVLAWLVSFFDEG